LSPLCETFSVEMDRRAAAVQPTTLHFCPLFTLPMEIAPRKKNSILLEKLGFAGFVTLSADEVQSHPPVHPGYVGEDERS
jgi:hypothetical protein